MSPSRSRRSRPRLTVQTLETRLAPATDTWINPAGGSWATGSNWDLGHAPAPGDDAVITGLDGGALVTHLAGTDTIHGLTQNGGLSLTGGSLTVTGTGTVNATLSIKSGAGLTVAAGATVSINSGVTVAATETNSTLFGITVDGTLNLTGVTFVHSGPYNSSTLQVATAGHLLAGNCTFAWSGLSLANGAILNSGDVTGNAFDQPITIPVVDAALLANNLRFEDVILQPGSLTAGQTATLSPLGTATTANQRYVFNAATGLFTVPAGATLNVTAGTVMAAVETNSTPFGITVNGTMTVSGASFSHSGPYNSSAIQVGAGGHLLAGNSTFAWSGLSLANGAILNSGDVTGNAFDQPITIPLADATLLANNLNFQDVNIQPGSLGAGQTATLSPLGTVTTANQRYVFTAATGLYSVQSGATLNVTAGTVMAATETNSTPFGLAVNGTMTVVGTSFTHSGPYNSSTIQVGAGGHLSANTSTFAWSHLTLANGSILFNGDVFNNAFDQTITIPLIDATLLANNYRFQDVEIQPGTLTTGQTATLAPLGTVTTVGQRYVVNAATGLYSVATGATLNITAGATVAAVETSSTPFGFAVTGTLHVSGASFPHSGPYNSSVVQVKPGGHLTAGNSTFAWSGLSLANGSLLIAGDIVNNGFDQPITIPVIDATLLANNDRFQDVILQPGSLSTGQTATLAPLGTVTTVNQRYVVNATTGLYAVQSGATLNIAPGTTVAAVETSSTPFGFAVTGTLHASGASFPHSGPYNSSTIQVATNGHLLATDSTFAWSGLSLANGAVLNAGDMTGNGFDQPITVPAVDATLLADNLRFQDVMLQPGGLGAGESATLSPLGTVTTVNQRYVITAATGNFTVQAGGVLNVASGAAVVAVETSSATFGIAVAGTMNVSGATFTHSGPYNSSTLQVNSGGHLTATTSSFAWSNVNLNAGSADDIQYSVLTNKLTVNSGAAVNVTRDDFSPIGNNGVAAVGTPTATIDLRNNFWGTTVAAEVAAKIQDHADDSTRPTVLYDPFLDSPPAPPFDPAYLAPATAGLAYDQPLTAIPGTGPATNFAVVSGVLPAGMTLSTDGVLGGTPTQAGSFTFTVSADDTSPGTGDFTASELYWLFVNAPVIVFTPAALPATPSNVAYNQTLTITGGTAPYGQFTISSGALPPGLSLSPAGVISGTPTTDGSYGFTVTVQDSTTGPGAPYLGSQNYTIYVDGTPPTAGSAADGPGADVDFQTSATTVSANWSGFIDVESGIAGYRWAIGTTPGGTDVQPFTTVGNVPGASASGLSLTDGTTYFVSVRAFDQAGNQSPAAVSDGVTVDSTPPTAGVVDDGPGADVDSQPSRTTIEANWSGFVDAVSGIASYRWAIGTTPGGTNVQPFTDVGLATDAANSGLTLAEDATYYVTVKAVDAAGNVGSPVTSDGVRVVPAAPVFTGYADDSGVVGDDTTSDTTPTLAGTADPGSTVKVFDGPALLGQTTADGTGVWQYATPALADGLHPLTATATDAGGGTSDPSVPLDLTVDTAAPPVTVGRAAGQADPTNVGPVAFAVHFGEPVIGFTAAAVSLAGSTVGGTLTPAVSGSGADYTITIGGMTGTGLVVVSVPAGAVTDAAGNASTASTGSDNSVLYNDVPPAVAIDQAPGQADPTDTAPVLFAVHFSEPVAGFDAADVDLSASTVGGTLSAAVTGSGSDYTVSVTGMFGAGQVIASIPPGAATDAAGNPSTASTSTDNAVAYNHVGQFRLSAETYTTAEGDGTIQITVSRANGGDGPAAVSYATADRSATAGDYGAGAGTLTWADGDTSDRVITIPIIDDPLNEGKETFALTLSDPTGNAVLGSPAAATVTIAASDGVTVHATDRSPQVSVTDADGDQEAVRLGGGLGDLTYYLTNGAGPVSELDLAGTDPTKSTLAITAKKPKGGTGDGLVGIGEIDGPGLRSLSLGKNFLDGSAGDGIHLTGFLGSLRVGDIRNGADIVVSGTPPKAGQTVKIAAGVIGDGTDVTVTGAPLGSLTAVRIGAGTITAPSVGSVTVTGRAKTRTTPAIPGDFLADLTVLGTGVAKGPALKLLHVAGAVSGVAITVGGAAGTVGDVGRVSVGSFVDSTLFAGYSGPDDGLGFFNLKATVGSFRVTAKSNGFANSYVIADTIKTAFLTSVNTGNGGSPFGLRADTAVGKVTVVLPQRLTYPGATSLGDFDIRVV
jgi:uncharacterized membrane protein YgdD (TMEM256/DUF423 family)